MSARPAPFALVALLATLLSVSGARADEAPFPRVWVGVAGALDFDALPPAQDVCALGSTFRPSNTDGYYCTNPDGTDFPSRHSAAEAKTLLPGRAGYVGGGPVVGDTRIVASLDYALRADLLVGLRAGFVTSGYNGSAAVHNGRAFDAPLHLEARATYLLGDAPLARLGFAPLALADAGVGEFDAGTTVQVRQSTIAGDRPKTAWITGGPFFVGAGGGFRYAFSSRLAATVTARFALALGRGGAFPTFAPEVGLQYGF